MNEKIIANSINKILNNIPDRSQEVLEKRFGLKSGEGRHTLESIGQGYGITRERVRQIENAAKSLILESDNLLEHIKSAVKDLEKTVKKFGGIMAEKDLLSQYTEDKDYQDHLHFILNLSKPFYNIKKTDFYDKI
jgi:beta-phosphoglucomutase-like phosphatase (HAD superfamily)